MPVTKHHGATVLLALALTTACAETRPQDAAAAPATIETALAASPADSISPADAQRVAPATTGGPSPVRAAAPTAPSPLRGIYLNAYAAGSPARLRTLLALADSTEINAFVIDVKDERGIRYRSGVELAMQLAQPGEVAVRDLSALAARLKERGVWSIARIVLFKDPLLSGAKPEWSIRQADGSVWRDREGHSWVSAWEERVWDYNLDIAEEVARAGFNEIQFDYVRFPESFRSLPAQVHPKAKGSRTDAIIAFLTEARRRLEPLGVVVAADVFGLSPNDPKDVAIGQQWEAVLANADHVLPMVYPSHYFPTHLKGVPRPNRMPYETVFTSVGLGMIRWQRLKETGVTPARVIPWLQAFNAPWVDRNFPYGVEQARAQTRAVYDVGLDDWIFWHPGSKYDAVKGAFTKEATSQRRTFSPSAELVAQADLIDRTGARAAREQVSRRSSTSQ
jgi:hypothetical protein